MEDIAAVVVEGESALSVSIPAIANIPFFCLTASRIDTIFVPTLTIVSFRYETLDDTAEKEPVGIGRVDTTQVLEFLDITLLRHIVQRHP